MITVNEFASMAGLSRCQIDRLRKQRSSGFPREYDLAASGSKPCPRFKLADVERWFESRALW
ncbi:hypothetical protein [Sphingomonas sp. Root1294]|nr:hypothetical protein [Sphingomonas sp. Root1294]KRB91114.1 hypothetical protein ASE22_12730 [Sphingomonas sp. Root720]